MKRRSHMLYLLLGLLVAQPACSDLPNHYSAEAIEAKVIDADTKKPIEGVIVTANWQLLGGMEGGLPIGQMQVMETQTDRDGVFRFPAWGPLKRPKGYIREDDPQLLLFKPGYEYKRLANEVVSKINYAPVRRSEWNGKTIELKSFRGSQKEYADQLSFLHTTIRSILSNDKCEWKKIPRLMFAIDKMEKNFRSQGIYSPLYSIENLPNSNCGSPREFFKGFRQ